MCGIAGAYAFDEQLPPEVIRAVIGMQEALRHRGPDAAGSWVSPDERAVLTATRLAIRDLRDLADQPFVSDRGTTVYNGELYAWPETALEGVARRTSGDTEVIHELTCADPQLLTRVSGMYAVATWRAESKSLLLARDPAGEKPLYIVRHGRHWLAFASELSALVKAGLLQPELDRDAIAMFLRLGYVPEPLSIYRGATPLGAGTIVEFHPGGQERLQSWWPTSTAAGPAVNVAQVRETVIQAVRGATASDLPVGLFLSSGVDSSVIGAAARAAGCTLSALTLTGGPGVDDESKVAAATARHLRMPHEIVTVTPDEALARLPEFFRTMDQPTVDGFNSHLICRAARASGLTVALSGVGGDELFRGYPSFTNLDRARWFRRIPAPKPVLSRLGSLILRHERAGDLVGARDAVEAYIAVRGVLSADRAQRLLGESVDWPRLLSRLNIAAPERPGDPETSLMETRGYLRSQLLRDLDVFAMGWSLEVRAPLLSPAIISLAGGLPHDPRLRGKQLLKQAFRPDLPAGLFERPKQGFSLPWQHWLRTSLRKPTRDVLHEMLPAQGVIDPEEASRALSDFERNRLHWSGIWVLSVLSQWTAVHKASDPN